MVESFHGLELDCLKGLELNLSFNNLGGNEEYFRILENAMKFLPKIRQFNLDL